MKRDSCRLSARLGVWFIVLLMLSLGGKHALSAQAETPDGAMAVQSPPPTPAQELPEIMTRGPVHEAFAEPMSMRVQEGLVTPVQPPPTVEELPPAERPQGNEFAWVPGYWAWDADRKGYVWVSGCWRIVPPGMHWVAGCWIQSSGGWQWVSGFWSPVEIQNIEYLPPPPAEVEQTLPPPPDPYSIWVPACWYWYRGQYVRRPAYWLTARPDWVWMPSYYVWTPRGYVMVAGHWDYPLERRGMLFAPVCFPSSISTRPGVVYSPSHVVNTGTLTVSLFSCPRYGHYYYGDYYDDDYIRMGIYPWFDQVHIRTWYDPIFEFDRWRFRRTEPRWEERQRHAYDQCRAHPNLRPARIYHEQDSRAASLPLGQRGNPQVIQPLSAAIAKGILQVRLEKISTDTRRGIARQAMDERRLHEERNSGQAAPRWTTGQPPARLQTPSKLSAEHKPTTTSPARSAVPVARPLEHKERGSAPVKTGAAAISPAEHKEESPTIPVRIAPVQPSPAPIRHVEPKRVESRQVVPAPSLPTAPNTLGASKAQADVPHAAERVRQSRSAAPTPARPPLLTPHAHAPKIAPQPAYTPPQALPVPKSPSPIPDGSSDSDEKNENSRGYGSVRH